MSGCHEIRATLAAYVDGELTATDKIVVERHLVACADCRTAGERERRTGDLVRKGAERYPLAPHLAARLREALAAAPAARPQPHSVLRRAPWAIAASLAVALLAIGLPLLSPNAPTIDSIGRDVVTAHVRGLVSDRLTDVASSDRHTVKPWFNGKLELSPPVEDLAADGYALVGGRLDYIGEHPAAALIYRHRQHVITLFVSVENRDVAIARTDRRGYNVQHWAERGMDFWAVSDLNGEELAQFAALLRARIAAAPR